MTIIEVAAVSKKRHLRVLPVRVSVALTRPPFGSGKAKNVITLTKNRHLIAVLPGTSAGIGAKSWTFDMVLFLLYCCQYAGGLPRQAAVAGPAEPI